MEKKTVTSIKDELSKALYRFSYGGLSTEECESIAVKYVSQLDFSKPGLAHKGVNWCAKEIIASILKKTNQKFEY